MGQLKVYNQATGNYVEILENDGVGLFLNKEKLTYDDFIEYFYKRAEEGKCFTDYIVVTPQQYEDLVIECMGMAIYGSPLAGTKAAQLSMAEELERFLKKRRDKRHSKKGDQLEFDFVD